MKVRRSWEPLRGRNFSPFPPAIPSCGVALRYLCEEEFESRNRGHPQKHGICMNIPSTEGVVHVLRNATRPLGFDTLNDAA